MMRPFGTARPIALTVFVALIANAPGTRAESPHPAPACPQATLDRLLSPATADDKTITLSCSITLPPDAVVTRQIVFAGKAASNAVFDCAGAMLDGAPGRINAGKDMIVIRSLGKTPEEMALNRPTAITVRQCRIQGSVRIYGLGPNGEAEMVRISSHEPGHTERAQAAAPTDIRLEHLTFLPQGRIPLYVGPGTTNVMLDDSRFEGRIDKGVAIYLDAESAGAIVRNTVFATTTASREQIALDGSANNHITGNRFTNADHGGIFLYRNCGEGGTVRHQTPHGNRIEENRLEFHKATAPAIWLGSRSGPGGLRSYCEDDRGYPFGSSIDNRDNANNNIVKDNVIAGRAASNPIVDMGKDNILSGNRSDN